MHLSLDFNGIACGLLSAKHSHEDPPQRQIINQTTIYHSIGMDTLEKNTSYQGCNWNIWFSPLGSWTEALLGHMRQPKQLQ